MRLKMLALGGVVLFLFTLVGLGPTMLTASQRTVVPSPDDQTDHAAPVKVTEGSDSLPIVFDPSYFNVTPITLPDGSIRFPDYTVPPAPIYTPIGGVTSGGPDPDKCAAARDGIMAVDASYVDEDEQLQQQVANYQNFLINNSKTYAARGYGPTADEQAADQRVQAAMQTASNKLMSNVRDANNKKAVFQQQIVQNC